MIAFEGASFGYGSTPILSDMTLSLEPGGFYFLTGPSGSGKTTFLKLCYLDLRISGGAARFFDTDTARMDREAVAMLRRRIGVVQQNCQFLDHLTVEQNVALPLDIAGRRTPQHLQNVGELMTWVALTDRAEAFPPELSGGELQRAALARAVILSPELVIADEPTGNVDRDMGLQLLGLLVELNRMGRTVIIATHDLDLIRSAKAQVAARVLRIAQGKLVQAGADL
ncbi:cell division ATP-binding protein FtsE [Halovulum sp. GXIMD14793]